MATRPTSLWRDSWARRRSTWFSCAVRQENGGLILDAGDFRLKAPENLKACLAPYAGKKVDLGIRPSDFELCQGGENAIPAPMWIPSNPWATPT